jgi:hypothetical protein
VRYALLTGGLVQPPKTAGRYEAQEGSRWPVSGTTSRGPVSGPSERLSAGRTPIPVPPANRCSSRMLRGLWAILARVKRGTLHLPPAPQGDLRSDGSSEPTKLGKPIPKLLGRY